MASVADIVVNLVAKTGRLESGLQRSNRRMKQFGDRARKVNGILRGFTTVLASLGGAAAVGGLAALVRQAVDLNDELAKSATTLGIATDKLKGLQLAASLAGADANSLQKALAKQQKAIVDGANGLTTYTRAFGLLGLEARELLNLAPEEQFKTIGDAMAGLTSQTDRIAVAYDIFGARNVRLINLLSQGRDAIEAAEEQARKLGVALSDFDAGRFEAIKDQITLMNEGFQGIRNTIALALLPFVQQLTDNMIGTAEAAVENRKTIDGWAFGLAQVIGALAAFVKLLVTSGRVLIAIGLKIYDFMLRPLQFVEEQIRKVINLVPDLFDLPPAVERNSAIAKWREGLQSAAAEQDRLIGEFRGLIGEADAYTVAWQEAKKKTDAAAQALVELRERLRENASGVAEVVDANALSSVVEKVKNTIAPTRTLVLELLKAREALNEGLISTEQFEKYREILISGVVPALEEVNEKQKQLDQFGVQAARNLQDAFANFFKGVGGGFKGLLSSFVNLLRDMVAEILARRVLLDFFGALAGGTGPFADFAKSVVGGLSGRALGGPVTAGQPYVVGETGRELFVPNQAGRIIPAGKFGGANFTFVNNYHIDSRSDRAAVQADIERVSQVFARNTKAEIRHEMRYGRFHG